MSGVVCMLVATYWSICLASVITLYALSEARVPFATALLQFGKLVHTSPRSDTTNKCDRWLRVPKKWFTHFYVVGLLIYGFVLCCSCISNAIIQLDKNQIMVIALLVLHIGRRLYECLYVSIFAPNAMMHVLHYLLGLSYYIALALTVAISPSAFVYSMTSAATMILSLALYTGALMLFAHASWHQHKCLRILAGLRRGGNVDYGIPRGDWFDTVSAPHYWAEVLIYVALWMLLGASFKSPLFVCLIFVLVNQGVVAIHTHRWYNHKFRDDYPQDRAIFIPGVL